MANPLKGEASFADGDETITLIFDAEAFLDFEDVTGTSIFAVNGSGGIPRLGTLAQLLAVAMKQNHGAVTRAEAVNTLLNCAGAQDALMLALSRALPVPDAAGNAPKTTQPKVRKAGAGKNS